MSLIYYINNFKKEDKPPYWFWFLLAGILALILYLFS